MLSPDVTARLEAARQQEATYRPNAEVAAALGEKNLVMFVGPAAVGKSYLQNRIVDRDIDCGRVSVFTTREAREDDEPGMFRCIPHDDEHVVPLLDKIERGEVVQYAVHPTSGRLYGSELSDYGKQFNLLATLSGIVNNLRQLPFQTTTVIGLAVEPDIWLRRFYDRPMSDDERQKRLGEAVVSLQWLLDPAHLQEVIWVDNTSEDDSGAVQAIINAVKYNKPGSGAALRMAHSMLERLQKELQQ